MPEFVVYRGIQMAEGWPEKIREAQTQTTLVIGGQTFQRIPYGRERGWRFNSRIPCHDCCVISGELHVPGCDMEQCPSCRIQLLSCLCEDIEDIEGEDDD